VIDVITWAGQVRSDWRGVGANKNIKGTYAAPAKVVSTKTTTH